MKDDFYKDIEHKRASKEEKDKSTKKHSEENKTSDKTFSRSERHKPKDRDKSKSSGPQNERLKEWRQKFNSNINRETLEKGKTLFVGKLSSYNNRVRDELKVSKEKLSKVRPARKQRKDGGEDGRRDGFAPTLIAGILILPVTLILGVLIISNFWPTEDTSVDIADNTEEVTEEAPEETEEAPSEGVDEDLQDQKAALEQELAESRNETDGEDLGTGSVEFEYSDEQQSELEAAASTAIEDKESGEAADSSTSVVETPEETEDTPEAESETEETPEETEEETTEEAPENSGGSTHVVSAGDNVYRIAMRYYGSGSAENVSKILEANGVSADSLSVGQELVIPE